MPAIARCCERNRAIGATASCDFVVPITGNAGFVHNNVVTAQVHDDEGQTATDDDDATVTITDVGPQVALLKDRPVFVAVSSGGRFSGPGARQPDFLVPYLQTILGMIGLHDLTFFSVQGTAFGPQAVAEARARAEQAMQDHFSTAVPPCT